MTKWRTKMTNYVNFSRGNQQLCPCCRGTKMMPGSDSCTYCNGTGFKQNLTGVDSMGLPPNNATVTKAPNKQFSGNEKTMFQRY